MNPNYAKDSQERQLPSFKLTLVRYVPATRNQLKGSHWSAEFGEKKRAAFALESFLESTAFGPPIGMGITSNRSRIALDTLRSWMGTTGIFSKEKSSPIRFTRNPKKEPRLKSGQ